MQQLFKRMLSVLLAVAVLLSLTATAFAADDGADAALTAADYAAADALFNALEDVEQTAARRDASADGRTQAICDYLNAQDAVVPGSVETSGERITWMTEQGIACAYSPRLEQIAAAAESTASPTSDDLTASPLVHSVSPFRAVPRTTWDGPFLSPDVSGYAENL